MPGPSFGYIHLLIKRTVALKHQQKTQKKCPEIAEGAVWIANRISSGTEASTGDRTTVDYNSLSKLHLRVGRCLRPHYTEANRTVHIVLLQTCWLIMTAARLTAIIKCGSS